MKVDKTLLWFGIVIILIFAPIARGAARVWSTSLVLLTESFLIFLWLWRVNNSNGYFFKRTKLDYPILSFAIIAVISFIFSIYKHDSFYALIKIFGYIGIYYLIVNELDHYMRKKLIWVFIFMGAILSAYGILQHIGLLKHGWWDPKGLLASTYVNHNHFAGYLELIIPIAIAVLAGAGIKELNLKLALVPFLVIMCAAFILTQSRGAWISLTASLFAMIIIFVKNGVMKRKNLIVLTLLFLIAVSFLFFAKDVISDRLSLLNGAGEGDPSASTRFKIWQGTARLVLHNPFIGNGIGNFIWAFPRFRPEGLNVTANFAHNDYLEMAAEMGVLAPIIFIWMLIVVTGTVIKNHNIDPVRIGCAAGILSLSLHGLVDFNFHIPANMLLFTVYAAIVMSPSNAAKRGNDA